jgi:glutamate dehydrogenase (NAD(P)+)
LEETIIFAYHEIGETWRQNYKIPDLSTAAFVVAIEKIADSYIALGIFP